MDKRSAPRTCLVIVTGSLFLWFLFEEKAFLYISIGVGLIASLSQKGASFFHTAWHWIGGLIGRVVGPLLLSLVFFSLLFPLGILSRSVRKQDLLDLKGSNKRSLWKLREHEYGAEDLRKMW